jgi:hypothetical protein
LRPVVTKRIIAFIVIIIITFGTVPVSAESDADIAAGVYYEVNWRITSDYTLILGSPY